MTGTSIKKDDPTGPGNNSYDEFHAKIDSIKLYTPQIAMYNKNFEKLNSDITVSEVSNLFDENDPVKNAKLAQTLKKELFVVYTYRINNIADIVITRGVNDEQHLQALMAEMKKIMSNPLSTDPEVKSKLNSKITTLNSYFTALMFANKVLSWDNQDADDDGDYFNLYKVDGFMTERNQWMHNGGYPLNSPKVKAVFDKIPVNLFNKWEDFYKVKISGFSRTNYAGMSSEEYNEKKKYYQDKIKVTSNIFLIDDDCFNDTRNALINYLYKIRFNDNYENPNCNW
jgi:hypothetical protein